MQLAESMAFSRISLLCGLLAFLLIANGVLARPLDDLINKMNQEKKAGAASLAAAPVPVEHAVAPTPANQLPPNPSSGQSSTLDDDDNPSTDDDDDSHDEDGGNSDSLNP